MLGEKAGRRTVFIISTICLKNGGNTWTFVCIWIDYLRRDDKKWLMMVASKRTGGQEEKAFHWMYLVYPCELITHGFLKIKVFSKKIQITLKQTYWFNFINCCNIIKQSYFSNQCGDICKRVLPHYHDLIHHCNRHRRTMEQYLFLGTFNLKQT